jgi:hypothetical protein
MVAFEYRAVEITTDSKGRRRRRVSTFHVLALELDFVPPQVEVRPERVVDRVTRIAVPEVELESDDFNRAFVVRGESRGAYDVLTPRIMQRLLAARRIPWRTEGRDLVAWQPMPFTPAALLEQVALLRSVASAVPAHARQPLAPMGHGPDMGGSAA